MQITWLGSHIEKILSFSLISYYNIFFSFRNFKKFSYQSLNYLPKPNGSKNNSVLFPFCLHVLLIVRYVSEPVLVRLMSCNKNQQQCVCTSVNTSVSGSWVHKYLINIQIKKFSVENSCKGSPANPAKRSGNPAKFCLENLEKSGNFFETTLNIFFHEEFSHGCMI